MKKVINIENTLNWGKKFEKLVHIEGGIMNYQYKQNNHSYWCASLSGSPVEPCNCPASELVEKKTYKCDKIGNLEWSVDEIILQSVFGKIGNIKTATVVRNRDTGRSRGFGFVEMTTPKEAEKAIQDLNGEFVNGREIMVREAKPEGSTVTQGFEKTINEFLIHAEVDNETDFSVGKKHFVLLRDK